MKIRNNRSRLLLPLAHWFMLGSVSCHVVYGDAKANVSCITILGNAVMFTPTPLVAGN